MSENRNKVELEDCLCINASKLAIQVEIGDGPKTGEVLWIPNSQVDDDSEVWKKGDKGTLIVSEWIAEQKGLI
jgi:hypothetical protein